MEESKSGPDSRLLPASESQLPKHFLGSLDKTSCGSKMDDVKSAVAMRPTQCPGTADQGVLKAQSRTPTPHVPPKGAEGKAVSTALSGGKVTFQKQQSGQYQQVACRKSKAHSGQSGKSSKDKKDKNRPKKPCFACSKESHSAGTCPTTATKGLRKTVKSEAVAGLDSVSTPLTTRSESLAQEKTVRHCDSEVVQSLAGEASTRLEAQLLFFLGLLFDHQSLLA